MPIYADLCRSLSDPAMISIDLHRSFLSHIWNQFLNFDFIDRHRSASGIDPPCPVLCDASLRRAVQVLTTSCLKHLNRVSVASLYKGSFFPVSIFLDSFNKITGSPRKKITQTPINKLKRQKFN